MHVLIIANGIVPLPTRVRELVFAANLVICADGGANQARALGITPQVILGDFDSIEPGTRQHFNGVQMLYIPDQESTDLEKALRYCIEQHASSVDIIGATGDRLDHTTGSLGCFKKFGHRLQIRLIDTVGELTLVQNTVSIDVREGEKLSLIPLDRCAGISTTNLKYPLTNDTLELGGREGISNEAIATPVTILVTSGTLLLYRFY